MNDLPWTKQNFASGNYFQLPLLSVKTNIHFTPLQISPFQIMADTWFYETIISAIEVALFYNLLFPY